MCVLLLALSTFACGSDSRRESDSVDAGADVADTADDGDSPDGSGVGDVSGDAVDTDDADTAPPPSDLPDGSACTDGSECTSGECLGSSDGFPDGMCTVTGCASRRDCHGGASACLRGEFNGNLCVALCTSDAECREGYRCRRTVGGGYCFPDAASEGLSPVCESELVESSGASSPWAEFPARLDLHRIRFDVSAEATAFSVVAFDVENRLFMEDVTFPDGTTLAIDDYAGYRFSPVTFLSVSPFLFPGGPQYVDQLQAGTYSMDVAYSGREVDDICFVVIEESSGLAPEDGELEIDVNFYFVDVPGLTALTADSDTDFQAMLGHFDTAFGQAGIRIGELRYLDVLGDVADRFSIVRTQDEAFELVKMTRQPGPSRDESLRVNVFFNRGFAGEMSGVLGVSAGLPGAMGLHGTEATGLVFGAGGLGSSDGRRRIGQTLAHEVGHFLGLFHTTERGGRYGDQLEDTPLCTAIDDGMGTCPDLQNLMFPFAAWQGTAEISRGQASILRANPLTKVDGLR